MGIEITAVIVAAVGLLGAVVGGLLQRLTSRESHQLAEQQAVVDWLETTVRAQGETLKDLRSWAECLDRKLRDERDWTGTLSTHVGTLEGHIEKRLPPPPPPRPVRQKAVN